MKGHERICKIMKELIIKNKNSWQVISNQNARELFINKVVNGVDCLFHKLDYYKFSLLDNTGFLWYLHQTYLYALNARSELAIASDKTQLPYILTYLGIYTPAVTPVMVTDRPTGLNSTFIPNLHHIKIYINNKEQKIRQFIVI